MAGACAVAVPVATPAAPPRGVAGSGSSLAPRGGSSISRRVNCRRDSPRVPVPTRSRVVTRLAGRDPGEAGTDAGVGQILKGDSGYLWTLVLGSLGGAAVIKYGSILLPDITRPNIVVALLMVSLPVVAAVLLLLKASSAD
ncbi:hypothetical protein BDA96_04G359300 [Sorghum bicolor]|uniref:Uncharacterized protein n=2 Tax=Sorghum bicolor TaxID=4558 RepID=C5XV44_SORBI|nr:uncharacterized protein LOC8084664 [Sorghum bicolor]EES05975.1 hypothetical protein SORBI_3004G335900 [Sorghum bicolor]KAG0535356.1 hypothetical protein BDA96_04G359300 [Sorghum bicolor]|eukprot:XP_002452999.1 uncharacterized protein LOC8084664 [Sorghum bicolor]